MAMNSPFKRDPNKQPSKGVEPGDLYYHTADILQVVRDNEIQLVVQDNKELISDVINANADKCGLKNILKLYVKTGDIGLFQQGDPLNFIDTTNLPTESIDELKSKLPADLVGDNLEKFLASITAQDLVNYFQAKEKEKSEVIVDEQKE